MSRLALVLLLLFSAGFASAQDTHDTHGKTEAQILSMGADKWMSFFTSKEGDSTASMTEAAGIYSEVAQKRGDRLLRGIADSSRRIRLTRLRGLLDTFAVASVDAGYCESEGGTMFNTMWASAPGQVEDLLYSLITHTGPKAKPMVVSRVRKQLEKIRKDIQSMHNDDPGGKLFKYGDALAALRKLNQSFDGIVAIARTMSRADSDRILGFCLDQSKNVDYN
ncbi:MAG TPA: hypothetical protein VMI31_15280 [Fimbriimonadaceae bacterium]|nr:hypothetical protein [Fimbriimonadaceae bacterium]